MKMPFKSSVLNYSSASILCMVVCISIQTSTAATTAAPKQPPPITTTTTTTAPPLTTTKGNSTTTSTTTTTTSTTAATTSTTPTTTTSSSSTTPTPTTTTSSSQTTSTPPTTTSTQPTTTSTQTATVTQAPSSSSGVNSTSASSPTGPNATNATTQSSKLSPQPTSTTTNISLTSSSLTTAATTTTTTASTPTTDDVCTNVTCKNGGTCQENGTNYTCVCTAGYSGFYCEIASNSTTSAPSTNSTSSGTVTTTSVSSNPTTSTTSKTETTTEEGLMSEMSSPTKDERSVTTTEQQPSSTLSDTSSKVTTPGGVKTISTTVQQATSSDETPKVTTPSDNNSVSSTAQKSTNSATSQITSGVTPSDVFTTVSPGRFSLSYATTNETMPGDGSHVSAPTSKPALSVFSTAEETTQKVTSTGTEGISACANVTCLNGGLCSNSTGMCQCAYGFYGAKCENDTDECVTNSASCDSNADCTNFPGGFNCTCKKGYTGDGQNCTDNDECVLKSASCDRNADCINFPGSFNCTCKKGYSGDGQNCTDIDECKEGTDSCHSNATCTNSPGSYSCTCKTGYTGDGRVCTDIDECLASKSPCDSNATCSNSPGSYNCTCKEGFTGNGLNCTDINECTASKSPCHSNANCTNSPGNYSCTCKNGYTGDGHNCTDTDECKASPSPCHNNANCTNLPGSYNCICNNGYTGDGQNCTDIDECKIGNHSCSRNANCTNQEGSYTCSCFKGFRGDGRSCTDVDECEEDKPCQNGSTCKNNPGSYWCTCQSGWTGSNCTEDIDECSTTGCAKNANCSNYPGNFSCTCNSGFRGDGHYMCFQEVLLEVTDAQKTTGDDNLTGPFNLSSSIYYFGKAYKTFYVSMNGYLTFGRPLEQLYPPEDTKTWQQFDFPIIAPLWSNIETSGNGSGLWTKIVNDSITLKKIKDLFGQQNTPNESVVCTWTKAVPYPYEQNHKHEVADFQVIIAMFGAQTLLMFNYDQEHFTWQKSADKKVAIGYSDKSFQGNISFDSSNFTKANEGQTDNVSNVNGRWIWNLTSEVAGIEYACKEALEKITALPKTVEACPCSLNQAYLDSRFMQNESSNVVTKFISRFEKGNLKTKLKCHYSSTGSLLQGPPDGGYLDFSLVDEAYRKCCGSQRPTCNLFYKTNPSDNCSLYKHPSLSLSWGDPHFQTLDGFSYTFNGLGEYTLVKMQNNSTVLADLQVRTRLVNTSSDATIFSALAAKDETNNKIEIIHNKNETVSIFVNGVWHETAGSGVNVTDCVVGKIAIINGGENKFSLGFESELYATITVDYMLDIVVSAPNNGDYTITGLLGNNNGDKTDDLRPKNDSGHPLNFTASEETIFYSFGQTWRVPENESIFNYNISGGSYSLYNNESITPSVFIGDLNTTNIKEYINKTCPGKLSAADVTSCGDNKACIVDALGLCDIQAGEKSKKLNDTAIQERRTIEHRPPKFNLDNTLTIFYKENKTVQLNFEFENVSMTANTSIKKDDYKLGDTSFAWNITSELRNNSVYLRLTANDSLQATSEYWPYIHYCGCEDRSTCDFSFIDSDGPISDRFFRARCKCPDNKLGEFCEKNKTNICYDNTVAESCNCSDGLEGDGIRCYDINECYRNTSKCDQTCINTEGSYRCDCKVGFQLGKDNVSCEDVNECENRTACGNNEQCENSKGGYTCTCQKGYVNNTGSCEILKDTVPTYAGKLVFKTSEKDPKKINGACLTVLKVIFNSSDSVSFIHLLPINELSPRLKRSTDRSLVSYEVKFLLLFSKLPTDLQGTLDEKLKNFGSDDNGFVVPGVTIEFYLSNNSKVYTGFQNEGLCNITMAIKCDLLSTNCVNRVDNYECQCKEGFQDWEIPQVSCKDYDECQNNSVCKNSGGSCRNTPGSYLCSCNGGYLYDHDKKACQDTCDPNPCKHEGQCIHGTSEGQYYCKCGDQWSGRYCEEENAETKKLKTIAIAVGASVGALCLLLALGLLGMYRRHRNKYSGYNRRPLSTDYEGTSDFRVTEMKTKDFPIDDESSTTYSIPRARLNQSPYEIPSTRLYDVPLDDDKGKDVEKAGGTEKVINEEVNGGVGDRRGQPIVSP